MWRPTIVLVGLVGLTSLLVALQPAGRTAQASDEGFRLTITVRNPDTGERIRNEARVPAGTRFQVSVTTNGVDCAGQFVVSALGAPGNPPSVLVQFVQFIVGPATGGNTVTGAPLVANALAGTSVNDWKISASCNGARREQFAHADFEFFARP